jgi:LysM repeat protein
MSMKVRLLLVIVGIVLLVGCGRDEVAPASPSSAFRTPLPVQPEEPWTGNIVGVPEAVIVPGRQSLLDLANHYYTTPKQLLWFNPDLDPDESVMPGTLVLIPAGYRADEGETISSVSNVTGIPIAYLLEVNPDLSEEQALTAGTLLVVPPTYFIDADSTVDAIAEQLNVAPELLLSANPRLERDDSVQAGTVILAPIPSEDEK